MVANPKTKPESPASRTQYLALKMAHVRKLKGGRTHLWLGLPLPFIHAGIDCGSRNLPGVFVKIKSPGDRRF